jgi:hypothetical protein
MSPQFVYAASNRGYGATWQGRGMHRNHGLSPFAIGGSGGWSDLVEGEFRGCGKDAEASACQQTEIATVRLRYQVAVASQASRTKALSL